jgi:hypothetical protein
MEDCPNTTRCGYCQLGGHKEDEGCPHAGEGEDRITEKPVTEREQRVKAAERYKNRNVPKNGEGAQSEHYGNGARDGHPVNGSQPDHHGNGVQAGQSGNLREEGSQVLGARAQGRTGGKRPPDREDLDEEDEKVAGPWKDIAWRLKEMERELRSRNRTKILIVETEQQGVYKAIPSDKEIRTMCSLRGVSEKEIKGVVCHPGYAEVNFHTDRALELCIFRQTIMTGADTWIISTRREGAVTTIVTFRSVPSNITDNAISEYILCFGTSIDGENQK